MPRILLEFIAVLCLVTVVASLMINSPDLTLIIPTLAMFGAASMRLLPSANRILGAIQSIRYGRSTIDVVFKELSTLDSRVYYENKSNEIKFKKIISLKSINFKYKSRKIILQNINIKIPKGKFIGIIGESGAGKSTLIDILLGLLKPNSGLVEVDNIDVRTNIIGWQKKIGYVPQDIYLVDDTLRQNIAFGIPKTDINNEKVLEAIKLSKLDDFVASLEDGLETLFGERGIKLSGGQLQRVAIARALYRNPEILILDEATSALDNETENFVMESVKNLKGLKTIIVITHRISTILNSDYVYKLKNGFIEKEGKPIDILNKSIQINTF